MSLERLLMHALSITTDPLFDPALGNGPKLILDFEQCKNSGDIIVHRLCRKPLRPVLVKRLVHLHDKDMKTHGGIVD